MRLFLYYTLGFAACLLFFVRCSEPTDVGSELIENQANVLYTDTLKLSTTSVIGDSVKTFDPTFVLANYLLGNYTDNDLGTNEAELNLQYRLDTLRPNFQNYKVLKFDSAAVFFMFDSLNCYGNQQSVQKLEVVRLTEKLDNTATYYSNKSFSKESNPLATLEFVPDLTKRPYDGDTTLGLVPYVKIPLPTAFATEMYNLVIDTNNTNSNDKFVTQFKGLNFRVSQSNALMMSMNLSKQIAALPLVPTYSNLTFYYQDSTNKTKKFTLSVANTTGNYSARSVYFKHTYRPNILPFINDAAKGDSLLIVQGMAGLNTKITLPDLKGLGNIIVNKAEIDISALLDNNQLISVPRILILYKKSDGTYGVIRDILEGANSFGGTPDLYVVGSGVLRQQYTFNISGYLQDYYLGRNGATNEIYLFADSKSQNPNRVMLYGPGSKQYPAKMRMTYTKLK